jgi:hypothetical protein
MPHHRASVNSNRDITTAQIKANEKERFGNDISYMAAYRTREKLREEIEGKEEEDFPRIWTYGQLLMIKQHRIINLTTLSWTKRSLGYRKISLRPIDSIVVL